MVLTMGMLLQQYGYFNLNSVATVARQRETMSGIGSESVADSLRTDGPLYWTIRTEFCFCYRRVCSNCLLAHIKYLSLIHI